MPSGVYKRKPMSEETRKRIGESLKGNKHMLGKHPSVETRKKLSEALKGNKNMLGKHLSEEHKKHLSEVLKEIQTGENNNNWKGGKRMAQARADNKRRCFGFIPVEETVYFEGSVAHHNDKNHITYIPTVLHESICHCLKTGKNMDFINEIAYGYLYGIF